MSTEKQVDRLSADARLFEKSATDVSRVGGEFWTDWLLMQPQMPSIPKNGYNSFSKYHYVLYEDLVSAIMETLPQYGFGYMQLLGTGPHGDTVLTTVIFHKSGQFLTTTAPVTQVALTAANAAQQTGAGIQYLRRYMLVAALGIVSDEDVDGQPDPSKRQAPSSQKSAAPPTAGDDASFIADQIYVNKTGKGKVYQMFKQQDGGRDGPSAAWFQGRDALREAASWIAHSDEELHEVGKTLDIPPTKVVATFNDRGYRDIQGLEWGVGEQGGDSDGLWSKAFAINRKLDQPLEIPSRLPGMSSQLVASAAEKLRMAAAIVRDGRRTREAAQEWLTQELEALGYTSKHEELMAQQDNIPDF